MMSSPVESGDPAADRAGFRRTLGEFATGVAIITTHVEGLSYGLTSNSFTSVSLDPPLVLWSIRRESQSFVAFAKCDRFVVNVLAEDQIVLSQKFARSGPDKFDGIAHTRGDCNVPLLSDVAARLECRRSTNFDGGDHLVMIGEVASFARFEREPLIFCRGKYAHVAAHPGIKIP